MPPVRPDSLLVSQLLPQPQAAASALPRVSADPPVIPQPSASVAWPPPAVLGPSGVRMPPSGTAARSAAGVTAYGTCFADGDDPDVSDASSAADTASYRLAEYLSEACPASRPLDSPTDPKRCDFEDWFAPDSSRLSSRPRFLMFPWVSRGGCVAPRSRERLLFQLRSLFTLRSLVSLGRRRCRVSVGTPFLSGVGAPGEAFHDYAGGWFFRPLVVVRYPLLVDAYRLRPQSVFLRS